jgi:N-dimethylarginine dimethylaminohydrolase
MFQNPRQNKILMCPPDHFEVVYVINPWMEGQYARIDAGQALRQWTQLKETIEKHAIVSLQPPRDGLPDLVFTANAGLVKGRKVLVSRFRSPERQGEEKYDRLWFEQNGFLVLDPPPDAFFEGAGDALFDESRDLFWVGHGFRSDKDLAPVLQALLLTRAIELNLVDPRFYHLDTCLSPLPHGYLMYFPGAFDARSRDLVETIVAEDRRIVVDEADALKFCCNAVALNGLVIMNDASEALQRRLRQADLTPVLTPLSEFLKAGGAAKCLTLNL